MILVVWLHLVAAMVWIGGMVFLSLVLAPALKQEPFAVQRGDLIRTVGLRFRAVVWSSIGVLLTTGPALMAARGWSLGAPGGWPAVLVAKLVLVTIVLALAAAHDFFIGPRVSRLLRAPDPSRVESDRLRIAWSSWLPRLSLVLALAVLAAAVVLARS